jgi:hypothetical protein
MDACCLPFLLSRGYQTEAIVTLTMKFPAVVIISEVLIGTQNWLHDTRLYSEVSGLAA